MLHSTSPKIRSLAGAPQATRCIRHSQNCVTAVSCNSVWVSIPVRVRRAEPNGGRRRSAAMTTGTLTGNERFEHSEVERSAVKARVRLGRIGLGTAGSLRFSWPPGAASSPSSARSSTFSGNWVVALETGACRAGGRARSRRRAPRLFVIAESRGIVVGKGRLSLATAGTLLMRSAGRGSPSARWPGRSSPIPARTSRHRHTCASSPTRSGYSIGVGLVLVVCGAFVDGWASRASAEGHRGSRVRPSPSPRRPGKARDRGRSSRVSEGTA